MGAGASTSKLTQETQDALKTLPESAQSEIMALAQASPNLRTSLPQPMKEIAADTSKTCVQRVQESLDAIEQREGDLNACIEILKKSALEQAAEADAKISSGAARRPLEGVPLLVKGNIDVKGTLSTAAMEGFAGWKPETTAPIAQKLIDAGAIPIAKTTLPEAAFGMWGWSKLHGLTKNPFNPKHTAGGSSTGSAVGLAAGYAPIAIGSDTEGSMRGPAEFAGVVGLRPTMGRYPDAGIVPCNIQRDTAGMMACTAADVAALDAVVMGAPISDYTPATLSNIKVAVPKDWAALGEKVAEILPRSNPTSESTPTRAHPGPPGPVQTVWPGSRELTRGNVVRPGPASHTLTLLPSNEKPRTACLAGPWY